MQLVTPTMDDATTNSTELWDRARALVDRAPSLDALRAHRLQLLAATLWRADHRPVPDELRFEERRAALLAMAAPGLLRRIRDAYDGELLLMKGPEVAARYLDPRARYFGDLDLLAADPADAQRALVTAGFREVEFAHGWKEQHHLCPLVHPGSPLVVEVHRSPKLPEWLPAPDPAELFGASVPSATGIDGVRAPDPATHALLLAGHSWAHRPPGRLGDVLDIAAVLADTPRLVVDVRARRWGWSNLWKTTAAVVDALLAGAPPPLSLRTWARFLPAARDVRVAEFHVVRVIGAAVAAPSDRRVNAAVAVARQSSARWRDEAWTTKLRRTRAAVAHPLAPQLEHTRRTEANGWKPE